MVNGLLSRRHLNARKNFLSNADGQRARTHIDAGKKKFFVQSRNECSQRRLMSEGLMQDVQKQSVDLLDVTARLRMVVNLSDVSEGYCCCGDSMDGHSSWSSGHSAVDAGDYYAGMSVKEAEKAADELSSAVMSKDLVAIESAVKKMSAAIDGLEATLDRVSVPDNLPRLLTNKEIAGKEFVKECVQKARNIIQALTTQVEGFASLSFCVVKPRPSGRG
mgnify:CR=1 FL=1